MLKCFYIYNMLQKPLNHWTNGFLIFISISVWKTLLPMFVLHFNTSFTVKQTLDVNQYNYIISFKDYIIVLLPQLL